MSMPIDIIGLDGRKRSAENQKQNMGMTGLGHTFQASNDEVHEADNLGTDLNTMSVKTDNEEEKHLKKA